MRKAVVTAALVGVIASSTGCFTMLGGIAGSMHDPDPPPPRRAQPRPPPRLMVGDELPPGWQLAEPAPPPPPPARETGMSNAGKGMIAGALVDAALIGLTYYLFSGIDLD